MYIEEIHMMAFGQFQDYKLSLDKGLTIIYGDNEAGKSTIWHFICGMFYGFYRPNIKTRRYLPEHEKYRPWTGNSYKGSLLLYDEQMKRHVRIYRDFMPGQESVEVLDEETGENISPLYETHPIYRCLDVAKKHLGMSYGSFMNTYGVVQLGQATDATLMEEVKQLLIEGMTGQKESISLQGIQGDIQDKLQSIGTKRRSQSPLGIAYDRLDTISGDLDRAIAEQKELQRQMEALAQGLNEDMTQTGLTSEELYEGVSILQEYQHVREESQQLRQRLAEEEAEYASVKTIEEKPMGPLVQDLKVKLATMRQEFVDLDRQDERLESGMNKKEHHMMMSLAIGVMAAIGAVVGLVLSRPIILIVMSLIVLGAIGYGIYSYRGKERCRHDLNQLRLHTIEAKSLAKYMEEDIQRFTKKEEETAIERENHMAYHLRMKSVIDRDRETLALLKRQEGELLAELEPYNKVVAIDSVQDLQVLAARASQREKVQQEWERLARQEGDLSIESLLEERRYIMAEIETLEHESLVYQKIASHLDEVAKALQKQVAPSLNEAITKSVAHVTNGRYTRVLLTPEMDVLLDGPSLEKPKAVEQLSRGTLDAIYISVRFALAKHVYGDRQRPYILDESLVHMDNERFESMMDMIGSEEGQRLLFTCHKREQEWLMKQGKEEGKSRGDIML